LTNVGSSPMHKLSLAASSPEFFTFGLEAGGELPQFPFVYQAPDSTHMDGCGGDTNDPQCGGDTSTDDDPQCGDSGVSCSSCSHHCSLRTDKVKVSRVLSIPIADGILRPKSTVSVPAWIRGNDIGGMHEIDFVFYYEPTNQTTTTKTKE
jgi:hypothetical protein